MNSITIDLMPYYPALICLSFLTLIVLIQSFLTAPFAFAKQEQVPGMPLKGDHSLLSFRVLRAYSNSVENLPAFAIIVVLAILINANALWINCLAAIHVVFRLAFSAFYYSGVGRVAGGPRTICYVGGLLSNIVLILYCLYVLLF